VLFGSLCLFQGYRIKTPSEEAARKKENNRRNGNGFIRRFRRLRRFKTAMKERSLVFHPLIALWF